MEIVLFLRRKENVYWSYGVKRVKKEENTNRQIKKNCMEELIGKIINKMAEIVEEGLVGYKEI